MFQLLAAFAVFSTLVYASTPIPDKVEATTVPSEGATSQHDPSADVDLYAPDVVVAITAIPDGTESPKAQVDIRERRQTKYDKYDRHDIDENASLYPNFYNTGRV